MVLCTYNGAAFIEAQLRSILNQTFPLHEVVVVDDCSTDNTPDIVASWAAQNRLIRLYRNPENLGYNKNFEKALCLAEGDLLAISDQDDVWHAEKIERLIRHWNADCPVVYCDSVVFSDQIPQKPKPGKWMNRVWGNDPRKLALYNTISGHAMLIRKELVQLCLPFNPTVYYDWWLGIVAMSNGGIAYLPQILVFQREHQHNASKPPTGSKSECFAWERQEIRRNLEQFRKIPNLSAADQQFFDTLYYLWCRAMEGKERRQLFLFLFRYRKIIFYSRKRSFAFFSRLKRSLRYAYGRGLVNKIT